jgi:drug/metabolite transporter (DMT)-like permease
MLSAYFGLLVCVIGSAGLIFLTRSSGRRGVDTAAMLLIAAFFGAIEVGVIAGWRYGPSVFADNLQGQQLLLLAATGLVGGVGTLLYFWALGVGPAGPIVTVVNLQLLLPVIASVTLWHKDNGDLSVAQWIGVALAIVSVVMIQTPARPSEDDPPPPAPNAAKPVNPWGWRIASLLAMLLIGATSVLFPLKQKRFPEMPETFFLAMYWLLCGVVLAVYLLARRRPIQRSAWLPGLAMSLLLIPANLGTLSALRTMNPATVYLVTSGGVPILVVLISVLLLGERYPGRVRLAVVAGLAAIVLMVLKPA